MKPIKSPRTTGAPDRSKPRPVTLWTQHVRPNLRMLALTVGIDREIDTQLLAWDILGSLGHAQGLRTSRLLSVSEHATLRKGLREGLAAAQSGRLVIGPEHEDAHSAVEEWLTKRIGRLGAKLHTARSRNEQIACDVRLWLKRAILNVHAEAEVLVAGLIDLARRNEAVRFPGYTHSRKAMPSSLGLWAAAHAAGLIDTLESLPAVWKSLDRSPMGSAAGYGVPLALDRKATARALGFASVLFPVTAVQNERGKLEAAALFWCAQLGHDVAKAAADIILYSGEEFGYMTLDRTLATGSSLMPHKQNPDLFELVRARSAAVEGDLGAILALRGKLASGYHRDFQLMKEPLFRGMTRAAEMVEMLALGVEGLNPDRERCAVALQGGVLATGSTLALAASGVPFREAYRAVSASIAKGSRVDEAARFVGVPSTIVAIPSLGLQDLRDRARAVASFAIREERNFVRAMERLAGRGTLRHGAEPWRRAARA